MPSTIIPCLRYTDAPAAIDFLCNAFGFTRHAVYADDTDKSVVHHAQLTLGDGMVMLGSAPRGEAAVTTLSVYVHVPDADAHCAHATEAGAAITTPPHDNDGYPGRGYAARDPEGNVWSFGSYDPWTA